MKKSILYFSSLGFKAQMKIRQEEYLDWVYTASLLLFLHRKEETIMGESVSYQMAPGEEVTFNVQRVISQIRTKNFNFRMFLLDWGLLMGDV
jgi:ligand-binding SRPBCC domain-containing protein